MQIGNSHKKISPKMRFINALIGVIFVIGVGIFLIWLCTTISPCSRARSTELWIRAKLQGFYETQKEFKIKRIKDKNSNGIGEYADTSELVEYMLKLDYQIGRYDEKQRILNLISIYKCKIFFPPEPNLQEQRWLCLAIPIQSKPVPKAELTGRSYYIDERGIVFFAEKEALETKPGNQWSLDKVFLGEPFKSPLNTKIWKMLDR